MAVPTIPENGPDVKSLLEENLTMTKELLKITKKVKSYLMWQQIFSVIKILIIAIPLIIGIIYLPPLLRGLFSTYDELLDLKTGATDLKNLNGIDLNNLPPAIQKMLNSSQATK